MGVLSFGELKYTVLAQFYMFTFAQNLLVRSINEYFAKRNTTLCSIYKMLYDLEGETIKQADKKYPNFGIEHTEYQSKLYNEEEKKLFKKYKIKSGLSTQIAVFGMTYCK